MSTDIVTLPELASGSGGKHDAESSSAHDFPDLHWRKIATGIADVASHCRVEREPGALDEGLVRAKRWQRRESLDLCAERVWLNVGLRPRVEDDLFEGLWEGHFCEEKTKSRAVVEIKSPYNDARSRTGAGFSMSWSLANSGSAKSFAGVGSYKARSFFWNIIIVMGFIYKCSSKYSN